MDFWIENHSLVKIEISLHWYFHSYFSLDKLSGIFIAKFLEMFGKYSCLFPKASTPLQKFGCLAAGTTIVGLSTGVGAFGYTKYREYKIKKDIEDYITQKNNGNKSNSPTHNIIGKIIFSPFVDHNDYRSLAYSLPVLSVYGVGQGVISMATYFTAKESYNNIKNVDECCKLIRMSLGGTIKYSAILSGGGIYTFLFGFAVYNTLERVHYIYNKKETSI